MLIKKKDLLVFGSGFIDDYLDNLIEYRKIKYLAIRGKKSLSIAKSLHGKLNCDPVMGDPALLVEKLIEKPKKKKYEVGFIPHYIDQNTLSTKLILKNRKIKYINILDAPQQYHQIKLPSVRLLFLLLYTD